MRNYLLFLLGTILFSSNAWAEIYKRVDADGRVTYSNIKTKGATRLDLELPATQHKATENFYGNKHAGSAEHFPSVDKQTQNQRDDKRKNILQSELASEMVALDQARKSYAEQMVNSDLVKAGNGSTLRGISKFEEKKKSLQADVDNHQRNIELLRKELDSLH